MKRKRFTARIGDGVRYDNGEYIVTCYPKNNNLTKIDEMAVRLCELEEKETAYKGCMRCIHGKAFCCCDSKRVYVGADGSVTVYVNGEYIDIPANFKYCPWCGTPLNVLKGGA